MSVRINGIVEQSSNGNIWNEERYVPTEGNSPSSRAERDAAPSPYTAQYNKQWKDRQCSITVFIVLIETIFSSPIKIEHE